MEGDKNLVNLCKWIEDQGLAGMIKRQDLFKATKDRKIWRTMIVHVLK